MQPESRDRFYAQALAVYAEGVAFAQRNGLLTPEVGSLHRSLAGLYRSRSVRADGALDMEYVALMVEEAGLALPLLPADSPEQQEVLAWLAEGHWLLLQEARTRRDWTAVQDHLSQLEALPPTHVDPQRIEREKRRVLAEQALQLLAQGEMESARSLIQTFVPEDALDPDPLNQALFTTWQVTLSVGPDRVDMEAVGRVVKGRTAQAQAEVDLLAQAWQTTAPDVRLDFRLVDNTLLLSLRGADLETRLRLAQATPGSIHWSLIRTLLLNSDAISQTQSRLLWKQIILQHQLDLRTVADQWEAVAASLARTAATAEADADASDPESALQGQIAAFTHQQEARRWRNLVQNSSVQVDMYTGAGDETPARTWILHLTDPPQMLRVQREVLAPERLLIGLVLLLGAIFALAGILWLLL
ncbi:MAG: hypothetical protein D6790_06730 [Caldilineae bacterium]|nr:MAG: hypothetical protein D6790_06730 [Caldilineae bacterium]